MSLLSGLRQRLNRPLHHDSTRTATTGQGTALSAADCYWQNAADCPFVGLEQLEPRLLLSADMPHIPGMVPVDTEPEDLHGQVVYLNFDGAEDVTYDGPVEVGPFNVPAFRAPETLADRESQIIANVVDSLRGPFGKTGVSFTTSKPDSGDFSAIYVGGRGEHFESYGSMLGVAEAVDAGNTDWNDAGFVFSERFGWDSESFSDFSESLSRTTLVETAHLLGYAHDEPAGDAGLLNEVNNGTVTVELVSPPSNVAPGELVDIIARIKFEDNTKSGPWQVTDFDLRDQDPFGTYQNIQQADDPLQIHSQGTWYYHTFENVQLSDWDDGGDGVELFAWGEVDDSTWNGFNPDDSSSVHQVTVGQPDLVVDDVWRVDSSYDIGERIDAKVSIRNAGDGSAGSSDLHYYLGKGSDKTYRDIEQGSIGSLDPGEPDEDIIGNWITGGWEIPDNVAEGDNYRIWVKADSNDHVDESNEGNNWGSSQEFTINRLEPDLVVDDVWRVDSSYDIGERIDAKVSIRNAGDGSAGSSDLHYYLGKGSDKTYRDIEQGSIGSLDPGEPDEDIIGNWITGGWEIPDNVAEGDNYRIWVKADSNDHVDESNEGNNWGSSQRFEINIAPDITALRWEDASGNAIEDGSTIVNRSDVYLSVLASGFPEDHVFQATIEEDVVVWNNDEVDPNVEISHHSGNKWRAKWQATWMDADLDRGLPEYFFTLDDHGMSSENLQVRRSVGWHTRDAETGTLGNNSALSTTLDAAELPAGQQLAEVAFEFDFGSIDAASLPSSLDFRFFGPSDTWEHTETIDAELLEDEAPLVRTFGEWELGQDFLATSASGGFLGDWGVEIENLASGQSVAVDELRTMHTYYSRLYTSGYNNSDSFVTNGTLGPEDPILASQARRGFLADQDGQEITEDQIGTADSAVILVHGWNPDGNSFDGHYDRNSEKDGVWWDDLYTNLSGVVSDASDWVLGLYDWVNDAMTGPLGGDLDDTLTTERPAASRDVGVAHGLRLAETVTHLFDQGVDKVQFLAHSAGNWVAKSASEYLFDTGVIQAPDIQLTSLDPFVTDHDSAGDWQFNAVPIFESLRQKLGQEPMLDNYYVVDGDGSDRLGWTSGDFEGWNVNKELATYQGLALGYVANVPGWQDDFATHHGPVGWYANTVEMVAGSEADQLGELGFANSLIYRSGGVESPKAELAIAGRDGITVEYSDDVAINRATIGDGDIRIIGPNGYDAFGELDSIAPSGTDDRSPLTATYSPPAPDGEWANEHNGTYTVALRADEVRDTVGKPVPAGPLGTFVVAVGNERPTAEIVEITPNPAQPPDDTITFDGSGTDLDGEVVAYEWRSDVDSVLGDSEDFDLSSMDLTVGAHEISLRVKDDAGQWSPTVTAELTVADATPTAELAGPTLPVAPEKPFTVTLGGYDNDEQERSIVTGELRVDGTVLIRTGPGTKEVTANATPGEYTLSYRVRDDEGTWSAPATVQIDVKDDSATIQGQVFADVDGDGAWDSGEVGLDHQLIELRDQTSGEVLETVTTHSIDSNSDGEIDPLEESGWYVFSGLAPGNYEVRPAEFLGTQTIPGGGTGAYLVSPESGEIIADKNLGHHYAGPFTVTVTDDAYNGVLRPDDLSLREALYLSQALPQQQTIGFDSSLSGSTITLSGDLGELVVESHVTIEGIGADQLTVDANGNSRVFRIDSGASLEMTDLTVTGGNAYADEYSLITRDDGGGIHNRGNLVLDTVVIEDNTGYSGHGGGLYNASGATATLRDTLMRGNTAQQGGGIKNWGDLTLENVEFVDGFALGGGGLHNDGGAVDARGLFFVNNTGDEGGGALYNSGQMTVEQGAFTGNDAPSGSGGAVANSGTLILGGVTLSGNQAGPNGIDVSSGGAIANSGDLTLFNATVSNNVADVAGGGLYVAGGSTTLTHVTVVDNQVLQWQDGAGVHVAGGDVTLHNTVIADNLNEFTGDQKDVHGAFDPTSVYNLIGAIDGSVGLGDESTQYGTATSPLDPMLEPLAAYGGATLTHRPVRGSPVVDAGSNELAVAQDGSPLDTDQRGSGFARIVNGTVDVGAVERQRKSSGEIDLDQDGHPDILWRNQSTGANLIWFMDGTTKTGHKSIEGVGDTNWQVAGYADFNDDGHPDILWRNQNSGTNLIWFMNGTTKIGYQGIERVGDTNWQVAGLTDFNSDGETDILWRNQSTGTNLIWFMDGTTKTGHQGIERVADTSWQVFGVADFNDDGATDLLWRNQHTGTNLVWFMDGTAKSGHQVIERVSDTGWQVAGLADFDDDGETDLLWRHQDTGTNLIWFMNGAAKIGSGSVENVTNTDWQVAGSHMPTSGGDALYGTDALLAQPVATSQEQLGTEQTETRSQDALHPQRPMTGALAWPPANHNQTTDTVRTPALATRSTDAWWSSRRTRTSDDALPAADHPLRSRELLANLTDDHEQVDLLEQLVRSAIAAAS